MSSVFRLIVVALAIVTSAVSMPACSSRSPTQRPHVDGRADERAASDPANSPAESDAASTSTFSTGNDAARSAADAARVMPMRVPLLVGTFAARESSSVARNAPTNSTRISSEVLHASVASLRASLPAKSEPEPLSRDVTRLLSLAADAIGKNNLQAALDATEEAERLAPGRVEPLEIRLVALLSRGSSGDVRSVLDAISACDPRNAVGVAFRGLTAAQAGRDAEALSLFALFIGEGAMERRGVAIPLPTEPGELEELAAACALRLGHADAALAAIAEAKRFRATDGRALRRITLLEGDALVMLGRRDEARSVLLGLIPTKRGANDQIGTNVSSRPVQEGEEKSGNETADEIAMLALLRIDLLDVEDGRAAARLHDLLAAGDDSTWSDFTLWRATRLAEAAGLTHLHRQQPSDGKTRVAPEVQQSALSTEITPTHGRGALMRVLVGDPVLTRAGRIERTEQILKALERDPFAMRCAFWLLAREDLVRAVEIATDVVLARPCELDAIVTGLLLAPVDVDRLLDAVDDTGRGAAADALRSRILARFGFADEAISVAEAARARDPASLPLLAAAALAAAEASDVTILGEVDEVAGGRDSAIAPILARAWFLVGDEARANDRRGSMGTALASGQSEDAARLEATGRAGLSTRLPFADECLALAAEIDPFSDALDPIAQRLTTPEHAPALERWARAAVAVSPSVPARRKLGLLLALGTGAVSRPTEIPPAPLGARFDALVLAPTPLRLAATLSAQRARPQTIDAQAVVARSLLATGDLPGAVALLERCARSESVEGNSRAIGVMLSTAADIAKREPSRSRDMAQLAEGLLPRLGRATSSDMLAAMRLAIVARGDDAALKRLAERLAAASRPLTIADTNGCLELIDAVRRVDDDPFPAAVLAEAIARDPRAESEARRRIARASVALGALSGGWWQRTESLIRDLAGEGLAIFVRASDAAAAADAATTGGVEVGVGGGAKIDIGRQLVRAADAHALIGDELGGRRLLERAVLIEPVSAEAHNNLAYLVIDRGTIDDTTIAMALDALAKAPDNPSFLDTVGVLRYRQGRLRDAADGMGAITLFRQALRIRPQDPSLETLDHLGDALWQDGDQQAAIRCWQQVGQVAQLRYPPQEIAKNLVEFQRREFGLVVLEPAPLLRRLYGRVADRAARKLEEVARGEVPSVRPIGLEAMDGLESGANR